VTGIKDVHCGPVTVGNALQQHFIRGRLSSDDAPAGCGVDGDDVLHDSLPVSPCVAALRSTKLLMSQRFGTSAPSAENGFVAPRIVSSRRFRRNTHGGNVNIFKMRKIGGKLDQPQRRSSFQRTKRCEKSQIFATDRTAWFAGTVEDLGNDA
jgi:hypothetical protein